MTRRSIVLAAAAALLLLAPPSAPAQVTPTPDAAPRPAPAKRPSIAGTWIPKYEKESMSSAGPEGWTKVNVGQQDAAVKFSVVHAVGSRSKNYELTYYADGRGETNPGMVYFFLVSTDNKVAGGEIKSETKWEGDALVVVHHVKMPDIVIRDSVKGGVVVPSLDVTMRWEVSPDGKTLTRTIKQSNFSAVFRQIVPMDEGQIKETPLPVTGRKETESKDAYVLLEEKPR